MRSTAVALPKLFDKRKVRFTFVLAEPAGVRALALFE
jgi:hypothetical protein